LLERTVIVANKVGLHARPAAEFVRLAARFDSEIKLTKDDLTIDGKSIMGVMMLAAEYGSRLTIAIDGRDEEEAMSALVGFLETEMEEGQA